MKVESQAGNFLLSFERMEPGDREILIIGKMGLWEATTHMSLGEFVKVLRMTLTPRMIGFLIRALFGGGRARPGSGEET